MAQTMMKLGSQSHNMSRSGAKAKRWFKRMCAKLTRRQSKAIATDPETDLTPKRRFFGWWD